MSTIQTGNPANVTTPLVRTIVSMADNGAGLIRVQTSAPHLFGQSDRVVINNPGHVFPGEGIYPIIAIDPTHFDCVGSAFSGTSTGFATDCSLTPQVQLPSDGDPTNAQLSGLLSAYQAILDRLQYIQARTYPRLISVQTFGQTGTQSTNYWGSGNWHSTTTFITAGSTPLATIVAPAGDTLQVNDIVEFVLTGTLRLNPNAATAYTGEVRVESQVGVNSPLGIAGARQMLQTDAVSGQTAYVIPLAMCGSYVVANPPSSGALSLNINGCTPTGAPTSWRGANSWSMVARVWRPYL